MLTLSDNLIVLGQKIEKEKSKTTSGINATLVLMKEMIDFQSKINKCVESQDIGEYKETISAFNSDIEKMYSKLLEIASGGIKKQEVPKEIIVEDGKIQMPVKPNQP